MYAFGRAQRERRHGERRIDRGGGRQDAGVDDEEIGVIERAALGIDRGGRHRASRDARPSDGPWRRGDPEERRARDVPLDRHASLAMTVALPHPGSYEVFSSAGIGRRRFNR
jgi:hypothetical protein